MMLLLGQVIRVRWGKATQLVFFYFWSALSSKPDHLLPCVTYCRYLPKTLMSMRYCKHFFPHNDTVTASTKIFILLPLVSRSIITNLNVSSQLILGGSAVISALTVRTNPIFS